MNDGVNRMKRIYISDLDGTLLDNDKQISNYTKDKLNELIHQGCKISIATARTPATVEILLAGIHIQEPIILMNGAVIYDLETHSYLNIEFIEQEVVKKVLNQLGHLVKSSFIYTINDNKLVVYYNELENEYKKVFYEERQGTPYKSFMKQSLVGYNNVAYFVFMDVEEKVRQVYETIKDVEGIALVMYRDIYSQDGYILEVYSHKATKGNAVHKLRENGYDQVICFGDNLNDIDMFKVADEAYAVENALEEVKACATGMIESNHQDGVAKYIELHYKKDKGE